jgi:hypothetical protein
MRVLLLLTAALALSACGTTSTTYVAENHQGCAMSSAREHAACVHAAGVKRAAATDVAVAR